jgi:hypothetical protein
MNDEIKPRDDELTADDVMEGDHVAGEEPAAQGTGIVSSVGSGAAGAVDVEPANERLRDESSDPRNR